jgi:hypothetical protein
MIEKTDTHLVMKGPGTFVLGDPWNETVEVEEGKSRRRMLPEDGEYEEPIFEGPPKPTITRRTYVGAHKQVLLNETETEI